MYDKRIGDRLQLAEDERRKKMTCKIKEGIRDNRGIALISVMICLTICLLLSATIR